MRLYLSVRRWVDVQWIEVTGYKTLVAIAILPFLLVPLLGGWWFVLAALFALVWTGFVAWRGVRVARANDANYDRTTKFWLSEEYRDTESATKAAFKRRRRRG